VDPDTVWAWFEPGWQLMPEARTDRVTWDYAPLDPWRLAYSPGVSPTVVEADGKVIWQSGASTLVNGDEVRAKAAEAAQKLFASLETLV
jgi:hypothetical protein